VEKVERVATTRAGLPFVHPRITVSATGVGSILAATLEFGPSTEC